MKFHSCPFRGTVFRSIPRNIPGNSILVHSAEHSGVNSGIYRNSTGMENTGIENLAEPSAKFHSTGFHRNDRIPAGIGGALLRPQTQDNDGTTMLMTWDDKDTG